MEGDAKRQMQRLNAKDAKDAKGKRLNKTLNAETAENAEDDRGGGGRRRRFATRAGGGGTDPRTSRDDSLVRGSVRLRPRQPACYAGRPSTMSRGFACFAIFALAVVISIAVQQ